MRHHIFVGSSTESRALAIAVQMLLQKEEHTVTVWDQGIFKLGNATIEDLLRATQEHDAAVFIFAPNDVVKIRGQDLDAVRDNVLFELGLFAGRLGRHRTFWIVPKGGNSLRIASDLFGIKYAEYNERPDNWEAALGPACQEIHRALIEAARKAAPHHVALPDTKLRTVVTGLDRALGRLSAVIQHPELPKERVREVAHGFEVHTGKRSILRVSFGRIENADCAGAESVVVLPSNEYFDDDCINDRRSSLGAFMTNRFGDRIEEIKGLVRAACGSLRAALAERETHHFQGSYGVGTCLYLQRPLDAELRMILASVTRMRAGEGIKAEPHYIFAAIREVCRVMNERRLTTIHLPLLGAGHGDLDPEFALLTLVLALSEMSDIRESNVVVFQRDASARPEVDPEAVRRILALVAA